MSALIFDLGGTFLRAAVVDGEQRITHVHKSRIPSVATGCTRDAIWETIASRIVNYERTYGNLAERPSPMVIAFPAPVTDYCHAHQAATVAGNSKEHAGIASLLEARTGRPVLLLNDVSAAAWRVAEITPYRRFLVVTVSSGIGSKMFIRESGVVDDVPFGGEIGHVVVDHSPSAPGCDCGSHGHLGAVASGRAVERLARRRALTDPLAFQSSQLVAKYCATPEWLTNEQHLVPAILNGDSWAFEILRTATVPLAQVLLLIAVAAGLDRVFLMGGFAQAIGPLYLQLLRTLAKQSSRFDLAETHIDSMFDFGPSTETICLEGCLSFLRQARRLGLSDRLCKRDVRSVPVIAGA